MLFVKAGGDMASSTEAYGVGVQMQYIEKDLNALWAPYRDIVGKCPKCNGTRMPGLRVEDQGFGCLMCHDFEPVIRVKSA